jgi:Alkylmercury lyase
MLAFRSEEHVDRWREQNCLAKGALFQPEQLWRLADAWYADRLRPDWRRKSPNEVESLFAEIGLTGAFWRLQAV